MTDLRAVEVRALPFGVGDLGRAPIRTRTVTLQPGDRVLLVVEDDLSFAMTILEMARDCGFNTLMLTMYPLHGHDWWDVPAYEALVCDTIHQARAAGFRVHRRFTF